MIRLLIVDDHQMFLDGLKSMLDREGGFQITQARNAAEAIQAVSSHSFEIVIMDIEMPDSRLNGVELTKQFTHNFDNVKVLIVSMNKTAGAVDELIHAGAKGYVIKDSGYPVLLKAIRELIAGNEYWDSKILQLLVNARRNTQEQKETLALVADIALTSRENDVLQLLAEGLSSKQIAQKLFIGTSTVDTHRKNLIAKFGAKNSTEVVMKAKEKGLF